MTPPDQRDGAPVRRLKTRAQFLAAARAGRWRGDFFTLQGRRRGDDDPAIGLGYTVTKKEGGAVLRNRVKRRLRAAAEARAPLLGLPGWDYVLIGRTRAATCDFARLLDDLDRALVSLRRPRRAGRAPG